MPWRNECHKEIRFNLSKLSVYFKSGNCWNFVIVQQYALAIFPFGICFFDTQTGFYFVVKRLKMHILMHFLSLILPLFCVSMEGVRGKTFERIHCEQTQFLERGDILWKLVSKTSSSRREDYVFLKNGFQWKDLLKWNKVLWNKSFFRLQKDDVSSK